ncbi:peptidyl-Lys metalloendopeptidase [Desarmillaria tabescens]|uniref:Peptidyl-Lys metalloendopeptidase n=1 Tax=Armillaria tabescens TaxID=1929756 RepID=A0AA39NDV1_ARMTA|nr:peptidyl-Lys metalloendopeptidase [Desarmillaria tabescens]KAK0463699.1 peptidyl-Lys metalloendopeptidase [Desarmillaria tabescens]
MFTPSLRSFLYAFCLSAAVVSAAPGLSLSLSGADSVVDVENLSVSATLTNTGNTTMKILNDPSSILSPTFSTNTFAINSASGSPSFVGMKVKYNPLSVVKKNREQSFTVLSPGESVTVDHSLANAYNFTGSGETSYTIAPSTLFYYIDADTNELRTINAETAQKHSAKLSGTLAVARRELDKRIAYNSCSTSEQSTLVTAAAAAQTYAENAQAYLDENTSSTTRYTTWFGEYNSSRHAEVLSHFSNMLDHPYADYTYDCSCTDTDTYAYVYSDSFGTIYLCGAFWDAPTTGTDSMGGTLIHESSHFTIIAGTDDYVYGQSGAQSLAESNPDEAIFNADSHEYFAENNPELS